MDGRKAAVFLWLDQDSEDAATFYAAALPNSRTESLIRVPDGAPAITAGTVPVVETRLCGLPYALLTRGPQVQPNDACWLQVYTGDQAETDRLWDAITGDGGDAIMCGWCKDRWGFRWQITPRALMAAIADPNPVAAARAQAVMMEMQKIDIAAIEAALRGDHLRSG